MIQRGGVRRRWERKPKHSETLFFFFFFCSQFFSQWISLNLTLFLLLELAPLPSYIMESWSLVNSDYFNLNLNYLTLNDTYTIKIVASSSRLASYDSWREHFQVDDLWPIALLHVHGSCSKTDTCPSETVRCQWPKRLNLSEVSWLHKHVECVHTGDSIWLLEC